MIQSALAVGNYAKEVCSKLINYMLKRKRFVQDSKSISGGGSLSIWQNVCLDLSLHILKGKKCASSMWSPLASVRALE